MHPFLLTLNLLCSNPNYGMSIHVEALIKSQTEYQVTLKNSHMSEMEMFRKEIHFDEEGSILEIETHHWVENFKIRKSENGWEGLYQYDLGYYPITCFEKK